MPEPEAKRIEVYQLADGTWTTSRRRGAKLIAPLDVALLAEEASGLIPAQFYVGCAQHETNFAVNERDTEPSGFTTWGLYQISDEEARNARFTDGAEMLDPVKATQALTTLLCRHMDRIRVAAKLSRRTWPNDLWAYLAIAHNQGLGACLKSIARYGMDWQQYKHRNPTVRIVSSGYGDHVIDGGPRWPGDEVGGLDS